MTIYPNPLTEIIQNEIRKQGGVISFARFMELALYHPTHGYYCRDQFDIGKMGDFTTAPHLSPLFAQCLANQTQEILQTIHEGNILELGAGTGQLAIDLLRALKERQSLPAHYYIYEISGRLRSLQKERLHQFCPDLADRVIWLDALPSHFKGVILANEVVDALPVHRFEVTAEGIQELGVATQDEAFVWKPRTPTTPEFTALTTQLQRDYELTPGYQSEVNLAMTTLLTQLATCMEQGVLLFIDYGYGQREYYHPERHRGTLTCFYQHHRHDNPLLRPGEQDITSHVDFTRVIELAHAQGLTLAGFTTQAAFLFSCGLLDIAATQEAHLDTVGAFNMHHAIKLLTLPTEMGERIKVMALAKNAPSSLLGFARHDRSRDL